MTKCASVILLLSVLLLTSSCCFVAMASSPPKAEALAATYTFEQYLADFGKTDFYSADERSMRRRHFDDNLRDILAHNAAAGSTYKKGVNHFTDMSAEEMKSMRGGRFEPSYKPRHETAYVPKFAEKAAGIGRGGAVGRGLPATVDYRKAFPAVLSAVKNQGMCGDCWAHSVTETVESAIAIATGNLFVLSQQQVTSCVPRLGPGCFACQGSDPRTGFDYVADTGITEEWVYPFDSFAGAEPQCRPDNGFMKIPLAHVVNISGYLGVAPNQQSDLMDAVANVGPVQVLVDASHWGPYESGIFDGCSYAKNISLDHAVVVVGYGTTSANDVEDSAIGAGIDYWIIRNSWSASWGEHGFIRIRRQKSVECGWNVGAGSLATCYHAGPPATWACGECGVLFYAAVPVVTQP